MRCLWYPILVAVFSIPISGCLINQYASNPVTIDAQDEWRRGGWMMNDQSSDLTPFRVHGGVGPAASPY